MMEGRELLIARTALLVALRSGDLLTHRGSHMARLEPRGAYQPIPALCRLGVR